jgi:hypothetical protein
MSVLNLAAGLSAFVGPALAWAFIGLVGAQGVVWHDSPDRNEPGEEPSPYKTDNADEKQVPM